MLKFQSDPVASTIIGAAIEVHRCLGPGLMEGVYQMCLAHELRQRGLQPETEVSVPVIFKGIRMERGFRLDFFVNGSVIVEVKCVERLLPIHDAQVLTYLRLTGARQALLFNFNEVTLKDGLKSFLGPGTLVPTATVMGQPLPDRDQDSHHEGHEGP
jgi:GxxExxY protein